MGRSAPYWVHSNPEPTGHEDQRPCGRGEHCSEGSAGHDPEGRPVRFPALGYRAFCETDRRCIERALAAIPDRYSQLAAMLGDKTGAPGVRVSGSRTPPIPVRVDVDALMREITAAVYAWWRRVAAIAHLSSPAGPLPGAHARVLAAHVDVMLALDAEPMYRTVSLREAAELVVCRGVTGVVRPNADYAEIHQDRDGVDAGMDFLNLDYKARRTLGYTPQHFRLAVPCWKCDLRTVMRRDGAAGLADEAECTNCGEAYEHERYQLLMAEVAKHERNKTVKHPKYQLVTCQWCGLSASADVMQTDIDGRWECARFEDCTERIDAAESALPQTLTA